MQMKESTIGLIVLLIVLLVLIFAGNKLPIAEGTRTIILWVVIGLIALWFIFFIVKKVMAVRSAMAIEKKLKAQAADQISGARPDQQAGLQALSSQLGEAIQALKASKLGKGALYALPWYMIIGPPGSGKSTALMESGLNFPYMSGGRKGIKGVGGTRNCDWWFTDQGILLDTAGRYTTELEDRDEWIGFLDMLKKCRQEKPINGVMVCVAVSDLLQATDEEVEAHTKKIRDRIDELTKKLEVIFPVYLLFTKCDLLNGFTDFFEDLSKTDRAQVWGFTMPYVQQGATDLQKVFEEECKKFYERLNLYRVGALSIDRKIEKKRNIYSFPLQFSLAYKRLGEFIGMLFRANPFQESSTLRGVYFTSGTQEGMPIDKLVGAMSEAFGIKDESASFVSQETEKKSFFINHLFTKIIFPDQNLARITSGVARRKKLAGLAILGGAVLGFLTFTFLFIISFFANRGIFRDVANAAEDVKKAKTRPAKLEVLDGLRNRIDQMKTGPSFFQKFLWVTPGSADDAESTHGRARQKYFELLRELFLTPLGNVLTGEIRWYLDNAGTNLDYLDKLYELNITYQILCGKMAPDDKDRELPKNVVGELKKDKYVRDKAYSSLWVQAFGEANLSKDLQGTAHTQLDYYYGEFAASDSSRIPNYNGALVEEVNKYLGKKYWPEAAYIDVRRVWNDSWRSQYPDWGQNVFLDAAGSDRLKASHTVPGYFTQRCFDGYVKPQFDEHAERIAHKYEKARIEGDAAGVKKYLYERYQGEYAGEWNEFIQGIEVLAFGSVKGARDSLQALCGAVSTNPAIAKIITEVWSRRVIVIEGTPWNKPKREADWLKLANDKLTALAKTLDDFVKKTGEGQRFRDYVDNKGKVHDKVDLGEAFNTALSEMETVVGSGIDQQDQLLRAAVMKFMPTPIHRAREAFTQEARDEMNAFWEATALKHYREKLDGKFPFKPDPNDSQKRAQDVPDATLKDFNDFFKPETGLLAKAAFYLKSLNDITINEKPLVKYTSEYDAASNYAQTTLQAILYNLNKNTVSVKMSALTTTSPQEYGHIMLKVKASEVDMKGQIGYRLKDAVWEGGQSVYFKLTADQRQAKVLYEDKPQTYWGLFRLTDSGQIKQKGTEKDYEMSWEYLPGLKITLTLNCEDKNNPFTTDFFLKFECPPKVAGDH